ncbi:VOC family protein [Kitasatospora sp. NPDC057692]|uniref:VOC family protein n=1 Tax=Kitasatospora sp. NPDC057692 TaxID=3346215 RepID=UPI0036BD1849
MSTGVRTVMTFAVGPEASARWWGRFLDVPVKLDAGDAGAGYAGVEAGGVEVGFHPVDDGRNPLGGSPVVYWGVDDVGRVRDRLLAAGCEHHRGPPAVGPGRRIAQLRDPFGTVFGTEGP